MEALEEAVGWAVVACVGIAVVEDGSGPGMSCAGEGATLATGPEPARGEWPSISTGVSQAEGFPHENLHIESPPSLELQLNPLRGGPGSWIVVTPIL